MSPSRRGSILLVVLVVLAALTLVAMVSLQFTGREREAALSSTREEEVRACADVARASVLARLRAVGARPTELRFTEQLPDAPDAEDRSVYATGHGGGGGAQVQVDGVELVVRGVAATQRQARDVTNLIGPAVLGGQYFRIAVNCVGRSGRQHEIELLVRFGI